MSLKANLRCSVCGRACFSESEKTCCENGHKKIKKEILSKWLYSWKNGDGLWGNQAGLIYKTIKENSIDESLKILEKDYKKYKHMGISSYIAEAMKDLKQIKNGK